MSNLVFSKTIRLQIQKTYREQSEVAVLLQARMCLEENIQERNDQIQVLVWPFLRRHQEEQEPLLPGIL